MRVLSSVSGWGAPWLGESPTVDAAVLDPGQTCCMWADRSSIHEAALAELVEWWEDLTDRETGSQVLMLRAASGWGASTLLNQLAGPVGQDDLAARVLTIDCVDVAAYETAGAQAEGSQSV